MTNPVTPSGNGRSGAVTVSKPEQSKEKILFEIQTPVLPTILNLENLILIGFTLVILIAGVVFRFGMQEFLIVGLLYLLIAIPSFQSIFRAGSTTYVLTNRRLVIFSLGFGPKERSIPLDEIQGIACKTSGLQRFSGSGDILVKQKGQRKVVRLLGIRDCQKRADQIRQAAKKVIAL
jgi:hypothetical protein